jgi:hypothetical protein
LLELVVTAEALLEVYLREFSVDEAIIGQLIERRDELLRSLARDEQYSLKALARDLRESADDEKDLEIAIVGGARALGFVARHISYGGQPDGLAHYTAQGREGRSFTLEAKSSLSVPSLSSLDFAGLRSHYEAHNADGCMVIAPSYPGSTKEDDAEAALRAVQQRVSCWTVDDLARVIEVAEARHITAEDIEDVILNVFAPADVAARVELLLTEPTWIQEELRRNVIEALDLLQDRLPDSKRTIDVIAGVLTMKPGFETASTNDIGEALSQLAKASKGMLYVAEDGEIFVRGAMDELQRRVVALTGMPAAPRRQGTLREKTLPEGTPPE